MITESASKQASKKIQYHRISSINPQFNHLYLYSISATSK